MSGFAGKPLKKGDLVKKTFEITLPASVYDPAAICYVEKGIHPFEDEIYVMIVPRNPFLLDNMKALVEEAADDTSVLSFGVCSPCNKGLRLFSNAHGGRLQMVPGREPIDEMKRFIPTTAFCHVSSARLMIDGELREVAIFRKFNAVGFDDPEMVVITEEEIEGKTQRVVRLKE